MRSQVARKELSATNLRNLRTLLLLNVFEPEEIGGRIRQARDEAGLTQEELGDIIDASTRQVQYYESGESKPYKKIKQIAAATGKTVEWLLHGEPDVSQDSSQFEELLGQVAATNRRVIELLEENLARKPAPKPAPKPSARRA